MSLRSSRYSCLASICPRIHGNYLDSGSITFKLTGEILCLSPVFYSPFLVAMWRSVFRSGGVVSTYPGFCHLERSWKWWRPKPRCPDVPREWFRKWFRFAASFDSNIIPDNHFSILLLYTEYWHQCNIHVLHTSSFFWRFYSQAFLQHDTCLKFMPTDIFASTRCPHRANGS